LEKIGGLTLKLVVNDLFSLRRGIDSLSGIAKLSDKVFFSGTVRNDITESEIRIVEGYFYLDSFDIRSFHCIGERYIPVDCEFSLRFTLSPDYKFNADIM
jgi:hypothetical protein